MSRPSSIEWFGLAYGGAGAIIIALNLGLVIYGFGLFLISSLLWSVIGWLQREMSLHRFAIGVSLVLSDQGSRVCGSSRISIRITSWSLVRCSTMHGLSA